MFKLGKSLFFGAVFLYLYLPIIVLIANSFNTSKYGIKWRGFSWKWYERLFDNDALLTAAWHSIIVAACAATFACVIGTLAAIALYRYKFRGKSLMTGSLFVMLVAPDIVIAIAFLSLFLLLGISLGFWSLLIAHITFCLPFVVVTVFARLRDMDPNLLAAAKDLGASDGLMIRKVLLPLLSPAIISGWLLAFTLSLDDVIVSTFVTGPSFEILPLKVFSLVKVGVSPEVNALSVLILLGSLTFVILSQMILKKGKR